MPQSTTTTKVKVSISQKMIDDYRRQNHSPNLFQHYIADAIASSDSGKPAISVFVFIHEIRVMLPPNDRHIFPIVDTLLKESVRQYYESADTKPISFIMDFSNDTITVNE